MVQSELHLSWLWYYIYMEHLNPNNILPYAQRLYDRGSREAILEFLQWNDPNGVYTDTASRDEGYEPLDYDEAILELEGVINDLMDDPVLEPIT